MRDSHRPDNLQRKIKTKFPGNCFEIFIQLLYISKDSRKNIKPLVI